MEPAAGRPRRSSKTSNGQHAGEQITKDTREKQLIGDQWAKNSGGKSVFVMATMEKKNPLEIRQGIQAAIKL